MSRHALAKLTRPRLYKPLQRDRLFRQLDELGRHPLTWIAAPPGAGKTTLVASFLDARKAPFFWYQLDAGDNDPAALFSYLVELWAQLKRPKQAKLPYLGPEYLGDVVGFSRRFFRALFSWFPPGGVLVFDNCQEVRDATFHQMLADVTQEVPANVRIIAISRDLPPAELARQRANHDLAELCWDDLRLTQEEAAQILGRKGLRDPERIVQLYLAADGWAGGLVLLGAGLPTAAAPSGLGGKEAVFEYFAGQVFNRTPQAERNVLVTTALLTEVTPEQAVVLSRDPGAAAVLERLHRHQYFTDRRTEPHVSYRYHDLFREFLLARAEQELDAPTLSALHLQAARLLLADGQPDAAIHLLSRGGHLNEAQDALLERAPALLGEGRWKTLLECIQLFPAAHVLGCAPLLYWRGMGQIAADPVTARRDLETALTMFQHEEDAIGEVLCVVGIIAVQFAHDDGIARYARLVDPLADLFTRIAAWPTPAMELEARSVFLLAASHLCPDHPLLPSTALRVLDLVTDESIDPNTRTAAGLRALVYFMWTGEEQCARRVNEQLETLFVAADAIVVHIAMGYAFRALYLHLTVGDSDAALRSAQQAQAIARENGLPNSECMAWQFLAVINAALARDLDSAEAALRQIAALGFQGNLNRETIYHLVQAHVCKWRHERGAALHHARLCLQAARENCTAFLLIVGSNLANVLADAGEHREAEVLLAELYRQAEGTCFANFGAALILEEAYVALSLGNRETCHARLRHALRLAQSDRRHAATLRYLGGSMPALFAEALENDIECGYVRELIAQWDVPPPSETTAAWPWPLSVRTLGRFEVCLHGKPMRFGRKAPRKALALLKALIAFGGTDVPEQALTDALWEDAEGDAAHSAYAMTLHRLRSLLGDADLLQQRASKLSLNRRKCWVDAWAFERCTGRGTDLAPATVELYGGSFLVEDDDAVWTAAVRERLRSRFIRVISEAAYEMEQAGQHEEAAGLYRRGLDADNLSEAFYQGLMRCHAAAGRTADAITTYLRLTQLLSSTFGVRPSTQTERLYRSLGGT